MLRLLRVLLCVLQTPLRFMELVTKELVVVLCSLDLVGCFVRLVPNPLVFGLELQWRAGARSAARVARKRQGGRRAAPVR